jgi:hypothetical protein
MWCVSVPTVQDRSISHPERKPLLCRQGRYGRCLLVVPLAHDGTTVASKNVSGDQKENFSSQVEIVG